MCVARLPGAIATAQDGFQSIEYISASQSKSGNANPPGQNLKQDRWHKSK